MTKDNSEMKGHKHNNQINDTEENEELQLFAGELEKEKPGDKVARLAFLDFGFIVGMKVKITQPQKPDFIGYVHHLHGVPEDTESPSSLFMNVYETSLSAGPGGMRQSVEIQDLIKKLVKVTIIAE